MAGTFGEPGVTFGEEGATFGNFVVIPPPDWVTFEGAGTGTAQTIEASGALAGSHEGRAALAAGVLEG